MDKFKHILIYNAMKIYEKVYGTTRSLFWFDSKKSIMVSNVDVTNLKNKVGTIFNMYNGIYFENWILILEEDIIPRPLLGFYYERSVNKSECNFFLKLYNNNHLLVKKWRLQLTKASLRLNSKWNSIRCNSKFSKIFVSIFSMYLPQQI